MGLESSTTQYVWVPKAKSYRGALDVCFDAGLPRNQSVIKVMQGDGLLHVSKFDKFHIDYLCDFLSKHSPMKANKGCPAFVAFLLAFAVCIGGLLTGCSTVSFYSSPNLDKKTVTGIKFYTAKPYLLVTRTGNKENPIKLEIVQLPDMENPIYAKYRPGWGSHEFSLKMTNGILTEYGQVVDSKGPETIGAVADLASSMGAGFSGVGAGVKSLMEGMNIQRQSLNVGALKDSLGRAQKSLNDIAASKLDATFQGTKDSAKAYAVQLKKILDELDQGNVPEAKALTSLKGQIEGLKIDNSGGLLPVVGVNDSVKNAMAAMDDAIQTLQSAKPVDPKPDFELYEIKISDGKTRLVRVELSANSRK